MYYSQPSLPASEESKQEENTESEVKIIPKEESQDESLDSALIDNFAANMLPGCVNLVSDVPETVYKACDLIVAISARNGSEWRDRVLGEILNTVSHVLNSPFFPDYYPYNELPLRTTEEIELPSFPCVQPLH